MARAPRLELAGVPHHVLQRGNNRAACFFNDVDRRFYLKCLALAAANRGCTVHAYVLMTNHVHLLVTPQAAGVIGAMMQDVGRRYVRIINTIHQRSGSLWEGRFKSSIIDSERYLLTCHRYIECNPVRAGMVEHALAYPWSSHAHYAGVRQDGLVNAHPLYAALGATEAERRSAFCSLFNTPLPASAVEAIRRAINTSAALGSDTFCNAVETTVGRSVCLPVRGRPPKVISGKLF